MKKNNLLILFMVLGAFFFSCDNAANDNKTINTQTEEDEGDEPGPAVAGDAREYTAGGVAFKMMAVPGGITFPTGVNDDAGEVTIDKAFRIAETEVTWELWDTVRTWALAHDYEIDEAEMGYTGFDSGSGTNIANNQHPVTRVGWYNSAVWCNALTEMVNAETGATRTPVYRFGRQPIRSSRDTVALFPLCFDTHTGNGFRLPDNMEWELAARWRGDDDTNTVPGYTNPHFTKGDSASGATKSWFDVDTDTLDYAVNQQDSTSPVKSKLPNALGLYDMSGNMYEFCDGKNDWWDRGNVDIPVIRGGRWGENLDGVAIGRQKTDMSLSHQGPSMGLRVAKFY